MCVSEKALHLSVVTTVTAVTTFTALTNVTNYVIVTLVNKAAVQAAGAYPSR